MSDDRRVKGDGSDNDIRRERKRLEKESWRLEQRKIGIETQLENLKKTCPHANVVETDYAEGSDTRTYDRCEDCKKEDDRGCLSKKSS